MDTAITVPDDQIITVFYWLNTIKQDKGIAIFVVFH